MKKKGIGDFSHIGNCRHHVNGMRFRQQRNHHGSSRCRG